MELLSIKKVKDGRYLKNYELAYHNKAGKEKIYEIVSHRELSGAADLGQAVSGLSIIATRGNSLLLLHEFRMGVNRRIYNLCAGMLEAGESPEECIRRELYEETGLSVTKIRQILPASFAAVAIADLKTQIAFVEVTGEIADHSSDNEDIHAGFYSKEQVKRMLLTEEFSSRAQLAAYYFAYR